MSENEETSVLTEVPDNKCVSSSCLQSLSCRYKCEYCDREFAHSSSLSRHVKTQHYTEKEDIISLLLRRVLRTICEMHESMPYFIIPGSSFHGFSLTVNVSLLKNFLLRN